MCAATPFIPAPVSVQVSATQAPSPTKPPQVCSSYGPKHAQGCQHRVESYALLVLHEPYHSTRPCVLLYQAMRKLVSVQTCSSSRSGKGLKAGSVVGTRGSRDARAPLMRLTVLVVGSGFYQVPELQSKSLCMCRRTLLQPRSSPPL